MFRVLFVAPDYLFDNPGLIAKLQSVFPRIVKPTKRELAVAELIELGADVNGVIIGINERLDKSVLDRLPRLEYVGFIGVGTDRIDVSLLAERKITLITAKGANADSVAEHALTLALAALKHLPRALRAAELGLDRFALGRPRQLAGRTVGTVGAGDSARSLHNLLGGFGCRRLYWTPRPGKHPELAGIAAYSPIDRLFAECDVVSLHVPLTEETRRLVTPDLVGAMPEGGVLVNASRGDLIGSEAATALLERRDLVYAMDDPAPDELRPMGDRLLSTPHIAGITVEALLAMQHKVVDDLVGLIHED